jgi:hypothetical protein
MEGGTGDCKLVAGLTEEEEEEEELARFVVVVRE